MEEKERERGMERQRETDRWKEIKRRHFPQCDRHPLTTKYQLLSLSLSLSCSLTLSFSTVAWWKFTALVVTTPWSLCVDVCPIAASHLIVLMREGGESRRDFLSVWLHLSIWIAWHSLLNSKYAMKKKIALFKFQQFTAVGFGITRGGWWHFLNGDQFLTPTITGEIAQFFIWISSVWLVLSCPTGKMINLPLPFRLQELPWGPCWKTSEPVSQSVTNDYVKILGCQVWFCIYQQPRVLF